MHGIQYIEGDANTPGIQQKLADTARRIAERESDYGHLADPHISWNDRTYDSYDAAYDAIQGKDDGWYRNIAVKYKDGKKTSWLLKFEYHC